MTVYQKLRHLSQNIDTTNDIFDLAQIMKIRELAHANKRIHDRLDLSESNISSISSLFMTSSTSFHSDDSPFDSLIESEIPDFEENE